MLRDVDGNGDDGGIDTYTITRHKHTCNCVHLIIVAVDGWFDIWTDDPSQLFVLLVHIFLDDIVWMTMQTMDEICLRDDRSHVVKSLLKLSPVINKCAHLETNTPWISNYVRPSNAIYSKLSECLMNTQFISRRLLIIINGWLWRQMTCCAPFWGWWIVSCSW